MVTICTASLTFNNSTFCPHSVFMCFVWIWKQTAIISLCGIDWLVFITETESVYCAVRLESLAIIQDKHVLLYIVVLTVIKRIKFVMCRVLFHVRTKHLYRIPFTMYYGKSNFLVKSTENMISYLASRNVRSVTK